MKKSVANPAPLRSREPVGWRRFLSAVAALFTGFLLAVYSSVFAQQGRLTETAFCAVAALLLSGYVAITAVPFLARRASSEWLKVSIDYQLTYEGIGFIALVILLAVAGLNTGNNLLFLVVACLLSALLISGVMSLSVLSGLSLDVLLPEHVFARRTVTTIIRLANQKKVLPSFSLTLVGSADAQRRRAAKRSSRKSGTVDAVDSGILQQPIYFPFLPAKSVISRTVDLGFPRRGLYREKSFLLSTRFPFGFLEKKVEIPVSRELIVFPAVEPTEDFYRALPMISGELEAYQRGRGSDLYSIRDMLPTDSARFVDWKASARSNTLKVREFTREDERRMRFVLDRRIREAGERQLREFDAAVDLCASLAWHFCELDAQISFASDEIEIPLGRGEETLYAVLRYLATVAPAARQLDIPAPVAVDDGAFRIVFSGTQHGSEPSGSWSDAYHVFFDSLLQPETGVQPPGAAGENAHPASPQPLSAT